MCSSTAPFTFHSKTALKTVPDATIRSSDLFPRRRAEYLERVLSYSVMSCTDMAESLAAAAAVRATAYTTECALKVVSCRPLGPSTPECGLNACMHAGNSLWLREAVLHCRKNSARVGISLLQGDSIYTKTQVMLKLLFEQSHEPTFNSNPQ